MYEVASDGVVRVEQWGDDFQNTMVLGGSKKKWFDVLEKLYDEKVNSDKWMGSEKAK